MSAVIGSDTVAPHKWFRFYLVSFSHLRAEAATAVWWGHPGTEVTDASEGERPARSRGNRVEGEQREPWGRRLGVHCSPPQLQM